MVTVLKPYHSAKHVKMTKIKLLEQQLLKAKRGMHIYYDPPTFID